MVSNIRVDIFKITATGDYRKREKVANTFPFHCQKPEHIKDEARLHTALECLRVAQKAEASGFGSTRNNIT